MSVYNGEMADYIRVKRNYIGETAVNRRRIENDRGDIATSSGAKAGDRDEMADDKRETAARGGESTDDLGAGADDFHVRRICSGENLERGGEKAGYLRGKGSGGSTPRRFGPRLTR